MRITHQQVEHATRQIRGNRAQGNDRNTADMVKALAQMHLLNFSTQIGKTREYQNIENGIIGKLLLTGEASISSLCQTRFSAEYFYNESRKALRNNLWKSRQSSGAEDRAQTRSL